jgi:hypothetical protein
MAITSIKTGSSFTNLQKYDSFLAGNTAFNPSSYESIASATGTGSSGTITFSSIPSTYKHLQIRGNFTEGSGNTIKIRFNSDTTISYAFHDLNGYGTAVYASGAASQGFAYLNYFGTASSANTMTTAIMDVHDYASTTKNKTFRVFTGYDQNGSGAVSLVSGLWFKTDAITSISIIAPNSWTTSTTFALYGIKG